MKREVELEAKNSSGLLSHDVQEFKTKLEADVARQLREHAREQDDLIRKEEDRLEQERKVELQEYERALTEQFEAEFKRKQQKISLTRENEERELELTKLRIEQQNQDALDAYRKQCQQKYDKERRVFEEEKKRRLQDI